MPSPDVPAAYDQQAEEYAAFADQSYTWRYIERPGFDKYISDLYQPDTRVLDFGCGTGRVIGHLISRGVEPSNIVGVDPSAELLRRAQDNFPDSSFMQTAGPLPFRPNSFDLITSNMVFHHLDNQQLRALFDACYDVLRPDGVLFFVDTDPDHSHESRSRINRWSRQRTPWGTVMPAFNHDMYELLLDSIYFAGFDLAAGWPLFVSGGGHTDIERFAKYSNKPSRLAARLHKVSPEQKAFRLAHGSDPIPSITD